MAVSKNWSNLRDFLRKSYNKEVLEWFADEPDPIPDNSGSRKNAKRACLILPKETQNIAFMKTLTFRFVVQRVHLRPNIYGIPIGTLDAQRKYRPQIQLYFLEDQEDVELPYKKIDGQISFRLMDETSETITKAKLTAIATEIKTKFGTGNGFIWKKGKEMASYIDKSNGYQFQLLVRNKTDAKEIITKVLDVNDKIPDWKYFNYKENDKPTEAYPTIPGNVNILNKVLKQPRQRPVASLRFQYATCSIWGKSQPVILYDRSFSFLNTLVEQ